MNRKLIRLLSFVVCAVMLFGMLPSVTAYAAETEPTAETTAETEAAIIETAEAEAAETEPAPTETEAAVIETEAEETPETEASVVETVAEETEAAEEKTVTVGATTDEVVAWDENAQAVISMEGSASAATVNADGLTQLAAPTNLEWGILHDYWVWDEESQTTVQKDVAMPGVVSWKPAEPTQGMAGIAVYKVGSSNPVYSTTYHFGSTSVPEWRSVSTFCASDPESGSYYFTITSIGDGVTYSNSATVTSGTWTYVKPSAKLDTCSNITWDWPNVYYDGPSNATYVGGYETQFLYAATEDEEPYVIGWTLSHYPYPSSTIQDSYFQQRGDGYYYCIVRALSSDLTVACNGDWSAMSEAYVLGEVNKTVEEELEDTVTDSSTMTDEEIRSTVQSMDTEELRSAMLADQDNTGAVADIAALEKSVGGAAPVEVTDEASAFEAKKVSIVGANLNNAASASDPIKLVIGKPAEDHVLDAAYNNSVAVKFSMDLDNVADTENLAVPVKITLPVPVTIDPDFLVVMHYHANGTVEELHPYVYQKSGQYYAEFVLTSFSDFTMTHTVDGSSIGAEVERIYGSGRLQTAYETADKLKAILNIEEFDSIIIASGDNFADALAGSYLAAMKKAPILLSRRGDADNLAYIQENLSPDGIVYILGGTAAVPQSMEDLLAENGVNYKRIKGKTRLDTNIEILTEAGVEGEEILVATGWNFADSLSASATGMPILLVNNSRAALTDAQKEYLAGLGEKKFTIIGGSGAVCEALAEELGTYGTVERLSGKTREVTSVLVAQSYFQSPDTVLLAYSRNFPDGLCGGPLAFAMQAPLLLVNVNQEAAAAGYVAENGVGTGYIMGGTAAVSNQSVRAVFAR